MILEIDDSIGEEEVPSELLDYVLSQEIPVLPKADKLELVGSVLLTLQDEVKKQLVHWATQLVIEKTSEMVGTKNRRPIYKSEKLTENNFLELDLDRTLDNYLESPYQSKYQSLNVFKRAKGGHSVLLIIDTSYSMSGKKIVMAAAAAATILHLVDSEDVSIIHFGTKAKILKHFDHEISAESMIEQIFSLIPKGFTNIYQGLKVGLDELGERKNTKYTAILLSDCDVNTGKVPSIIAWKLPNLKIITIPPINEFMAEIIRKESKGKIYNSQEVNEIPKILIQIFSQ